MPRLRPKSSTSQRNPIERPKNVLQSNRAACHGPRNCDQDAIPGPSTFMEPLSAVKSILDDDIQPGTSSSSIDDNINSTSALYDELDTFRLRWRRELESNRAEKSTEVITAKVKDIKIHGRQPNDDSTKDPNDSNSCDKENIDVGASSEKLYATAKALFLRAVQLEQDELHHESIRYYKQALRLYPDIEKQIFKEQCEESARAEATQQKLQTNTTEFSKENQDSDQLESLSDRIVSSMRDDYNGERYPLCRPAIKMKPGVLHISDLPYELVMQIFRHIIGQDLDLASLGSVALLSRGFYLLSRDHSIWKGICCKIWGDNLLEGKNVNSCDPLDKIDWMQMYLTRPRVNHDGVYISRTRYIRQGDVGFQDLTYRPFHVIRYYRYLRFFTDKRVLVLTTNEEPEKIVPIFRNAQYGKQFSPELSVMEGKFEFIEPDQVIIVAEKDCRRELSNSMNSQSARRQAQFHWSRQTPISQKFSMRFELKTLESKPYRNNVLKWLDYTIATKLEDGHEVTSFDLSPDSFPNLLFSRVKRLNLRLTNPLPDY